MKRPREINAVTPVMVNRAQLAAIFDVTVNVITKWVSDRGAPVERIGGGRGHSSQFDLVKVFAWWRVEFDAVKSDNRDAYYGQMVEKVRLANAEQRGELHDLATCSEQVGRLVDAAKAAFIGLASWAEQVGIVTSHAEYAALHSRVWETLDELSGGAASAFERRYGVKKPSSEELARRLSDEQHARRDRAADVAAVGATEARTAAQ